MTIANEVARASLVIADFDGTLVYLETDWAGLKQELSDYCIAELGVPASFDRLDEGLRLMRNSFGDRVFRRLLEKVYFREREGFQGSVVHEVLQPLLRVQKEKQIAVFSLNCRRTIEEIIPLLGLEVSCIVAKEDVEEHKPSGNGILQILDRLGVRREDAIFIGDSRNDMLAGRDAGVKTILWAEI
ncbi:MAG: HAD-IA family hydrolase [Nitrospirales bacterium]|nr:HAD-IA family hydrolase [Nitrospirales bacterium]